MSEVRARNLGDAFLGKMFGAGRWKCAPFARVFLRALVWNGAPHQCLSSEDVYADVRPTMTSSLVVWFMNSLNGVFAGELPI